jgi:hypothetical protein
MIFKAPFFRAFNPAPSLVHRRRTMTDPLSAIASVLGTIDVSLRTSLMVLRLIQEWNEAPIQVRALSQEIIMSRDVTQRLQELCKAIQRHQLNEVPSCTDSITVQLDRANPLWAELEQILLLVCGPKRNKARKLAWMRKAPRVASLQAQLQEIRSSVSHILNIYSTFVSHLLIPVSLD